MNTLIRNQNLIKLACHHSNGKPFKYPGSYYRTISSIRFRQNKSSSIIRSWKYEKVYPTYTVILPDNLNSNIYNYEIPNNPFGYQRRYFNVGYTLYEHPSSKVEASVNTIKNKQKEKAEENLKKEITQLLGSDQDKVDTPVPAEPIKKTLKQRVWAEILHYYHGFKLLFIDINICRKLIGRTLKGKTLTRRENRLLIRTTSDVFRLIPFSVFIVVPFLEFFLPLFIKFFPGMLPSTFQTNQDREVKLKQSLQMKIEVAKFLQKTLDEMALQHKDHRSSEAKSFTEFFSKIKNPNEYVPSDEIIKFSKRFEAELTLNALTREQLMALCRVLELNTIGTSAMLRFQLRMKLRSISADDRVISREGVESLNLYELQQACKTRGMRAYGLAEEKLRFQLTEWIYLNLNEKVPSLLLLLSRAMMVSDEKPTTDKLKETIRNLPDTLAAQTKAAIGELEGKIDNKTKIEIIKEEERKIREEQEEEREAEKLKQENEKEKIQREAEELVDPAPSISMMNKPKPIVASLAEEKETHISSQDVELLGAALDNLSKEKKSLLVEKEKIRDLKEEIEDYKEDVEELKQMSTTAVDLTDQVRETRGAKILFKKVNKMIGNLNNVLVDLEKKQKELAEVDFKEIPEEQVPSVEQSRLRDAQRRCSFNQKELVRIDDLVNAIKQLKTTSDESRLKTIENVLSKIDADQDGQIKVDDVLRVIEAIGRDNVKLNEKQLEELLDVLDKEEIFEAEDKIERAIAKSLEEVSKLNNDELKDKAPIIEDKTEEIAVQPLKTSSKDTVFKDPSDNKKPDIVMPTTTKISSEILPPTTSPSPNPKDKMI